MNRAPLVALACFLAIGCDEKKDAAPAATPASGAAATPASGAAAAPAWGAAAAPASGAAAAPATSDKSDVKGTVVVPGKIPPMEDLKRNSDAFCAKKQM